MRVFIFIMYVFAVAQFTAMEKPEALQGLAELPEELIEPLDKPLTNKAIARLTKSASLGNVESQISLVRALLNDDPDKALEWAKKAGERMQPALFANIYFFRNDVDNTKNYIAKALEQKDPHSYRILGQMSLATGDYANALSWYAKGIQAGDIEALYARAMLFIAQHKDELAKKDLQVLISRNTLLANEARGHIASLNHDFLKAIDIFKKENDTLHLAISYEALAQQPSTSENMRAQYQKEAEKLFTISAQEDQCGVGYYHLGLAAMQESENQNALKYFTESFKKIGCFWEEATYPGNANYYMWELTNKIDPVKAEDFLHVAVERFKNPDAALKLGLRYYNNKDLPVKERIAQAKKYLQIAADAGKRDALYNLATIAEYEKDYSKAKELFGGLMKEQYRDAADRLKMVIKKQLEEIKK